MSGLVFTNQAPVRLNPGRADIACFVGFVRRRAAVALPDDLRVWLRERGWEQARGTAGLDDLLQLPVPLSSWELFDRLFAWEERPLDASGRQASSYLGAALRSFFAQGGRLCYVVRAGDPWPYDAARAERLSRLEELLPGYPSGVLDSDLEQNSWRGIGHLAGLPEVSFLCLPDLVDAVGMERTRPAATPPPPPRIRAQFVECSAPAALSAPDQALSNIEPPRCDQADYNDWAEALWIAAELVARRRPEVQLVAALPMPAAGSAGEGDMLRFLSDNGRGPLAKRRALQRGGLASAFVQLAYPWVRSLGSAQLPGDLESPDAVLAGVLARVALTRSSFHSAAGSPLGDVTGVAPELPRAQLITRWPDNPAESDAAHTLPERISLLGPTPRGLRLISDVTTSLDERYRPACIGRCVALVLRAARRMGRDAAFEPNGPTLWAGIRAGLGALLEALFQAGAMRGATPEQAFAVRCDRSTMTQADIDAGRAIATVAFEPAVPVERIEVVLAMSEGARVTLIGAESEAMEAI
jgi:hypothetical protein